jgi:hypothetical protein
MSISGLNSIPLSPKKKYVKTKEIIANSKLKRA